MIATVVVWLLVLGAIAFFLVILSPVLVLAWPVVVVTRGLILIPVAAAALYFLVDWSPAASPTQCSEWSESLDEHGIYSSPDISWDDYVDRCMDD